MKVAIVSFGHVDSIITLAKYLSRDIEVDLYILLPQNNKRTSILNFKNITVNNGLLSKDLIAEIFGKEIVNYIEGKFNIYLFIYFSYRTYSLRNIKFSYNFSRIIKERQYDLVHFNGNEPQQLTISLLTPKYPKIHTIHDYRGHSGERNYWGELFNKSLINGRNHKIIHSYYNADQASGKNHLQQKRIDIIPYGPLEVFRVWKNNFLREENNSILFFGRISPYKGIEYLIKAVPIIKEKIADLKVIFAGEGHYYFSIENLKKDNTYQLINRYIPNEELVGLIQKSALIICPYTDATQSGVVMTAYAFNKPVVATNVGGISEVVEDSVTGSLVPPRNPQKLAEAIIDLLKDKEKMRTMSENIKNKFISGEYSWDSIANKTIDVYKKALKNK